MHCHYKKYTLNFIKPGGTSRGVLKTKDTYFIFLEENGKTAIGECNRFINLSYDDKDNYEEILNKVCRDLPEKKEAILTELREWPSIYFGVEMLLKDWRNGSQRILFPEVFKNGAFSVPINGLIWMGEDSDMREQIDKKLAEGCNSIKLKIGALDFERELALIQYIRKKHNKEEVEIRLDANGAYSYEEALEKLAILEKYGINYIEQPIAKGDWESMHKLIKNTSIKIALDEELIGIINETERQELIDTIQPDLLILKPALIGGFSGSEDWKKRIRENGGDWIVTSALESNIGLNAIAQYVAKDSSDFSQGLGTGQLFSNNFPSPYEVKNNHIYYKKDQDWNLTKLI